MKKFIICAEIQGTKYYYSYLNHTNWSISIGDAISFNDLEVAIGTMNTLINTDIINLKDQFNKSKLNIKMHIIAITHQIIASKKFVITDSIHRVN